MSWSARQYRAFEDERTRPVRDLLAAVPDITARTAVDLGCGPGNSTEMLAARFPDARIMGLDSSPDMIEAARRRLPHIAFALADIARWDEPGPCDVILANASLQWLPDHGALFPALAAKLAPGGALAIQMPDNLQEPAHRRMRETAEAGPWAARLARAAGERAAIDTPAGYYGLLVRHCRRVDVWRTTYHHALDGVSAIVEWFKGSGLRPYLEPLDSRERGEYLARYAAALEKDHPVMADGKVLLPFPRLFIVAVR